MYAVTGLYNFILLEGKEPGEGGDEALTPEVRRALAAARDRADLIIPKFNGVDIRRLIANWFWKKY
jgi:hypothetical protein